jgi:hypothetical protein
VLNSLAYINSLKHKCQITFKTPKAKNLMVLKIQARCTAHTLSSPQDNLIHNSTNLQQAIQINSLANKIKIHSLANKIKILSLANKIRILTLVNKIRILNLASKIKILIMVVIMVMVQQTSTILGTLQSTTYSQQIQPLNKLIQTPNLRALIVASLILINQIT